MEVVVERSNMIMALRRVERNRGTAGIDEMTVAERRTYLKEHWPKIKEALLEGSYQPQAVRRVEIAKPAGGMRQLGIPTVVDRLIQQALNQVLSPIFDPNFSQSSYGFRPGRKAHQAVRKAQADVASGKRWIVDMDLEKFFDRVNHDILMSRLARGINDKRLLAVIRRYLEAGMLADGVVIERHEGTPQGGPLSPLLANIALSVLDEHFDQQWQELMGTQNQRTRRRKNGLGTWRLIRYCDDFVVMVHGERRHAEVLREEVADVLATLGLRLSLEKTRVVHIDEGFDFLGHNIRRQRKRGTSKYYVYTRPSKKAVQAIKDKVGAKTYRSTRNQDLDQLITSLNQMLAGWARHFRHGVSKAVFSAIDSHAWGRLMRWIRAKHQGKGRLGMKDLRRRFCDQGWRFAHNGVVFTGASSVTVTRYRYRGSRIPTPWTIDPAAVATG